MNSATVFGRRAVVEGGQMRNEGTRIEIRDGIIRMVEAAEDVIEDEKEKNSTSRNSGTLLDADLVIPGFVDIHTHGLGKSLNSLLILLFN